ncbi:MAG: hypothetical protein ACI4U3_02125 [Traorella sp.]
MVNENRKIFSYSFTPSYGFYEEDNGGFEIEINLDGNLIHTTYYYDHIEKSTTLYPLSSTTIEQINKIIKNIKKD